MRAVLVTPLLIAIACGTSTGDECDTFEPTAPLIDGAVTIGSGDADSFVPTADDAVVELELGSQGGWMVRPVLRVDTDAIGAGEGSCVWAEVNAAVDGSAPITSVSRLDLDFGDALATSAPMIVLLSFDLEEVDGASCAIEVTVEGPSAASTSAIQVTLRNDQ